MADRALRRINVDVYPTDLERVANGLRCRHSEAVRRLVDNDLLAADIDEVRRMAGSAPDPIFRPGARPALHDVADADELASTG